MDKSVIIVIVVVAVALIGIPLASSFMKSSDTATSADEPAPSGSTGAPPPSAAPQTPLTQETAPAAPAGAQALDANSLVNTQWSMTINGIPVTVSFLQGGALQAQSPALRGLVGTDTVGGRWSVSGSNVTISATAGPHAVSETATISGNTLVVGGMQAQRLR